MQSNDNNLRPSVRIQNTDNSPTRREIEANLSGLSRTAIQLLTFITKASLNKNIPELKTARLCAPVKWHSKIDSLIALCEAEVSA